MAIVNDPYKLELIALYKMMEANPMTLEEYAARFTEITDKQILTGEVEQGIPVTSGGATSARGQVV